MFHLTILTPKKAVFDGDVEQVFLPGDHGEFEILPHHAPVVSLLKPGNVVVDWKKKIPIRNGIMRFDRNECMLLVEE